MEYINEININEAVIHVLDSNVEEPVLNEYRLELNEDTYKFLYRHIEKCLKDDELKYARLSATKNMVKETVQDYLNGIDNDLISLSKELANQLFLIMNNNLTIPSADLIIASIITDQGPMIAILKMDYVKTYAHEIQIVDKKIGVGIIPQLSGLPSSSQRIQKAAFIKPIRTDEKYNLMILDKQKRSKEDEYEADYFLEKFLKATIVTNERDVTKAFVKAAEKWTRKNIPEDAEKAEGIRTTIKSKLKEGEHINLHELSTELFNEQQQVKEDFLTFIQGQGLSEEIAIDKAWVDKKLKRTRLNIDKQIDLYIDDEVYRDINKFEIQRNGDGSINMLIKNVINYIEK